MVTKEMYTFEDKGGRSLTLRPEQTAGIVRAYLAHAHDLPTPFKAYHVSQQFRHGRPQAGRLREFRQFGVETIGSAAPNADVEVDRARRTGSSAGVASPGSSCAELDRRRRVPAGLPREADRVPRTAPGRSSTRTAGRGSRTNPLRVFDCKVDGQTPLVLGGAADLRQPVPGLRRALRGGPERAGRGAGSRSSTTPGSSGGSTTTRGRRSSSCRARSRRRRRRSCGGGRYDGLAEVLGGPPTPGVGFALGLDRILMALREEGVALPGELGLACFVVSIGDEAARAGGAARRRAPGRRHPRGDRVRGAAPEGAAQDGRPLGRRIRGDPR